MLPPACRRRPLLGFGSASVPSPPTRSFRTLLLTRGVHVRLQFTGDTSRRRRSGVQETTFVTRPALSTRPPDALPVAPRGRRSCSRCRSAPQLVAKLVIICTLFLRIGVFVQELARVPKSTISRDEMDTQILPSRPFHHRLALDASLLALAFTAALSPTFRPPLP